MNIGKHLCAPIKFTRSRLAFYGLGPQKSQIAHVTVFFFLLPANGRNQSGVFRSRRKKQRRVKATYSKKVHQEAMKRSSSKCSPLSDGPDLRCHAPACRLEKNVASWISLSPLSRPHPSPLFFFLSAAVGPFHRSQDDQSHADRSEIMPALARQARQKPITSGVERFNIELVRSSRGRGVLSPFICWLKRADDSPGPPGSPIS